MKQIKTCLICQNPVSQSLAYQGELEFVQTNPITGEKQLKILGGFICPNCNQCFYKTSAKKLERYNKFLEKGK